MNSQKIWNSFKKGRVETTQEGIKKKATSKRWQIAHASEEEYWMDYSTESLSKGSGERFKLKADILLKEWKKYIKINKNTKILQVGCGPEDVINHFKIGKKDSVDPLADFYKKRFKIDYKISNFKQARGEEVPFKDKSFDIVILANVLDHTELPEKVISEMDRVLKDKGLFHFENYIYQKKFVKLARFWGGLKETITGKVFNIHHPYMFTLEDIRTLLSKKFSILEQELGRDIGTHENLTAALKSIKKEGQSTQKKLAKFGFIGSINYIAICKKNNLH